MKIFDSQHLKSFHSSNDIIERISSIEMRNTVACGTRKKARMDTSISMEEFHTEVIIPFINALQEEILSAFDLSDLPILLVFLKLDPSEFPGITCPNFATYGNEELRVLYDFYGSEAKDEFHGRTVHCERLLFCPFDALKLAYGGFKCYVGAQKKEMIRESKAKQKRSLLTANYC